MRIQRSTLRKLRERARLAAEPHSKLAERYIEEGLAMDGCPGVYFAEGRLGRRAAVIGSGLDVWEIIEVVKAGGGSVSKAAAQLEAGEDAIDVAIRYYGGHKDEIDDWIARVHELRDSQEEQRRLGREAISK